MLAPIFDKKLIVIGNNLFFDPSNPLFLEHDYFTQNDNLYICNDPVEEALQALKFSTYDGFALKNIFHNLLNIPVVLAVKNSQFSKIIKIRCHILKIQKYFLENEDLPLLIKELCHEFSCRTKDIALFDNTENLDAGFLESLGLVASQIHPKSCNKNFFPLKKHHPLRNFVIEYVENAPLIQDYYNQTNPENFQFDTLKSPIKNIRAIAVDIDGTCTDASKIFDANGHEWKCFNTKDIAAIREWHKAGNLLFFITGEENKIPPKLAQVCHVPTNHVYMSAGHQKAKILDDICPLHNLTLSEVGFIGDDMNDRGALLHTIDNNGLGACPSNALPLIQSIPGIKKLNSSGGNGAIHEFIELCSRERTRSS